jgi:predicted lipoprotein with Yx(FWY)xxD motif
MSAVRIPEPVGRVVGAGLLGATGAIHLDLYVTGYRTIPTIGWLFLLQVIAAFVLCFAVLAVDSRAIFAAGALFSIATLGGYLLSIWIGLFGFKEVRTTAGLAAGIVEIAAFAVLGWLAVVTDELPGDPAARRQAVRARLVGAVALGSLVAGALLGSALASADSAERPAPSTTELKLVRVGTVELVADAKGFVVYLFVPDTSTTSHCYGECAAYWPPVLGKPTAGRGITGHLGTIRRTDGALQSTYDGHPLYTYVGDSSPAQANGNGIDLNGGYWYDMRASGMRG